MKVVKVGKHFGVQSKHSDSFPEFVDCQKASESTGTIRKDVLNIVAILISVKNLLKFRLISL